MKLKKGDDVIVLSGKYRGERAKVEAAHPATNQVVLDTLNIAKKHTKQRGAVMQAGIIDKFMPLDASNVALWCSAHKGPARVGYDLTETGTKVRVCRNCGTAL
jgi:large subunit ribosomal protein L24